mmetsp:Transcript_38402/g.96614  ORF Transcript_38402/g.96614 Transcript_38402/m.96614 type:complete len:331 (+) Transcript_38402:165-1157(+)|eukprot:CAMPEP_0177652940 /NCGR_PEP_ID=MMETSP0447-20121125/13438_1 /TAXON_ID=0 /ORGANISM="Stygamoeba regulata, Strain BSH-02190019" /LENGTH=330 /DNA_ID=CAMNT_0019156299 /DNA_START=134 /DNA_END=1126 /DNA_ORIENTATION=-
MQVVKRFTTHHEDVIHDLCYDFYGKRLATCSSDQQIKVWDQDEDGEWQLSAKWKAHAGSIWKVVWAHPEFGQVLASCSFDKTICIWHEQSDSLGKSRWVLVATLSDSRDSVTDIKFSPKHLGLKLAAPSADGYVRVYEAIDVMDLSHWQVLEEFEVSKGGTGKCMPCISWNPSQFDPPTLVVGTGDSIAKLWEFNESYRRWQQIDALVGHTGTIHDVCWAPNVGRTYHLIATGSKDGTVRIWKLNTRAGGKKSKVQEEACFDDHEAEVWRVEWNITGTVLASSGDDGVVRLWKANFKHKWTCLSVVSPETEYAPSASVSSSSSSSAASTQ